MKLLVGWELEVEGELIHDLLLKQPRLGNVAMTNGMQTLPSQGKWSGGRLRTNEPGGHSFLLESAAIICVTCTHPNDIQHSPMPGERQNLSGRCQDVYHRVQEAWGPGSELPWRAVFLGAAAECSREPAVVVSAHPHQPPECAAS